MYLSYNSTVEFRDKYDSEKNGVVNYIKKQRNTYKISKYNQ